MCRCVHQLREGESRPPVHLFRGRPVGLCRLGQLLVLPQVFHGQFVSSSPCPRCCEAQVQPFSSQSVSLSIVPVITHACPAQVQVFVEVYSVLQFTKMSIFVRGSYFCNGPMYLYVSVPCTSFEIGQAVPVYSQTLAIRAGGTESNGGVSDGYSVILPPLPV